ncbi:MAG TPA: hypothetical protein DCY20_03955 [Firmicutes bacterium]|nr:hypothetical protein [Bacillota bacterium]
MKLQPKIYLFCISFIVFTVLLLSGQSLFTEAKKPDNKVSLQKNIQITNEIPMLPLDYEYVDWQDIAQRYNTMLFDFEQYGLGFIDRSYYNTEGDAIGLKSYIGADADILQSQAINVMGALLSAYFVEPTSVDKGTLDQYVQMLDTYYNFENGEGILLNLPDVNSTDQSFWQQIYPSILYFMLMDKYESDADSEVIMQSIADRWYDIVMELGGKEGQVDFAYTGYNFKENKPYDNGEWIEPDAAAGIALIQYFAYERFQDTKYMQATRLCMKYLDDFQKNPGYDILYLYLPYLAARLNALEKDKFDTSKYMDWVFNQTDAHEHYGMLHNKFGIGLFGDANLYGGSAKSFESIVALSAIVPTLKYDQRFAVEIGRYILHASSNLRLFYPNYLEPTQQSDYELANTYQNVVPYAELHQNNEARSPYGSGVSKVSSQTSNLSLVSGSFLGLIGGMIQKTDVDAILQVNLNLSDYYVDQEDNAPHYLLFNPYEEEKTVTYNIEGDGLVSLYDTVSQEFVAEQVKGNTQIKMNPMQAVIIVELPVSEDNYEVNIQKEISSRVKGIVSVATNIVGLNEYEPISHDTPIELDMKSTGDTKIKHIEIFVDKKSVFKNVTYAQPYTLDTEKLSHGYHILSAEVIGNDGTIDRSYARIFIQKNEEPYVLNGLPKVLSEWSSYQGGRIDFANGQSSVKITNETSNATSGVVSAPFKLNLAQVPLLSINVEDYAKPWSMFIQDVHTQEKFYLIKDKLYAGPIILNMNYELFKNNSETFQLKGEHEVQLGIEVSPDGGFIQTNQLRILEEGLQPLQYRAWKTALTTKKLLTWQVRPNSLGKINFYKGLAEIKNLSKNGSGGIVTNYFAIDFSKNPELSIKVKEVDELWSVYMYIENDTRGYYLQPPTNETGTFTYKLNDVLEAQKLNPKEIKTQNVQFWIVSNGDYGTVTKMDYFRLAYQKNWFELAAIGVLGLISIIGICVNLNKES